MIDVTPKVHAGWISEVRRAERGEASPLQLDMDLDNDVEVSSSPALSSSSASTREGRFTWRAPDIDEELWAPSTPKDSPKDGVCFNPPALSPDADAQPNQITVFDGRSGLPAEVLQQPKLLVNHMRKHRDRSDILMQCCVWLQLQVAMGARESKGPASCLVEAGAIEAVVDCMHRHTDKTKFQEAALWALWTFAAQECYLQRVTSSGAIEPIITAMRKHPHEAGVQVQALWCVYWLTVNHTANRSKVVSLGGSDLVSMAAWNHREVKSITDVVPTIQICLAKDAAAEMSKVKTSPSSSDSAGSAKDVKSKVPGALNTILSARPPAAIMREILSGR